MTSTKQPLKEGTKYDSGKPRWSLFPMIAQRAIVGVLEFGAQKYAEENWRQVEDSRKRYYNAATRHINDWWDGETYDPQSKKHHLAHAICCLVFLMTVELEQEKP